MTKIELRYVREKLLANFLENPGLCYLLRGEMQTSSATGRLLERDGSFYPTKVFGFDDMPRSLVTISDNVHLITNKLRGLPTLANKTRIVGTKSKDKFLFRLLHLHSKNFKVAKFRQRPIYS